ncbi:MAG: hypothetical protein ABEN55_23355, partial [Bradymonadaceae bacterium]
MRDSISLPEALAKSAQHPLLEMYPNLADTPPETRGEILDTNAIAVVERAFASRHSFARPGDLLLTFRALDAIALLRPEQGRIVWATRGGWWHPSDVDPLPDGDILVF